jgi:hypothetical protein
MHASKPASYSLLDGKQCKQPMSLARSGVDSIQVGSSVLADHPRIRSQLSHSLKNRHLRNRHTLTNHPYGRLIHRREGAVMNVARFRFARLP